MADPICRWRNSSIKQIMEFNTLFPLCNTNKNVARELVEKRWNILGGADFFTTPYQLAAQMGIYYEDYQNMYPKFSKYISLEEAQQYMRIWGKKYYAPNPYTKSLQQTEKPIIINNFLVNWCLENEEAKFSEALRAMFVESIGNTDILVNMLNNFSEVSIANDIMTLKENAPKTPYDTVFLEIDKNDKKYFFDFVTSDLNADFINVVEDLEKKIPLQTIFYGAPGTGKSYKVNELTKGDDTVIRTTFHPDYDYAQFVGCYKPTKENKKETEKQVILDYSSLVEKFKEYLAVQPINITKACTLFGYDYHDSLVKIQENGHTIAQILEDAYKGGTTYSSQIYAGMTVFETSSSQKQNNSSITYSFVPQVFTNALVKAYESHEPVYLVIEEINRGNCAQIFGDIFQLLDRNANGESEYAINVDEDLKKYLEEKCPAAINDGKIKLPRNFNIIATMNTSDQSLFPMDSAFKRRWEWEYVPIRYTAAEAKDDKDNFHTFTITIDDKHHYLWTDFLQKVNAKILSVTDSEDKQMGEYFIKKSINQNEFINKVMYYLWSEVGKDNFNSTNNALFVLPDGLIKETKDGKEEDKKEFSFNELFKDNATELLIGFMKKLEVKSEEEKAAEKAATSATPTEV